MRLVPIDLHAFISKCIIPISKPLRPLYTHQYRCWLSIRQLLTRLLALQCSSIVWTRAQQ